MALRLRVTYGRVADFLADVRDQVARGGLLVRVDVGPVERGDAVELEIATAVGRVTTAARVLQPMHAAGVAVELEAAQLAPLVEQAKRAGAGTDGGPPVHEQVGASAAPAPRPEPSMGVLQAQRIQVALHGDKNQRMAILREPNKLLHGYVLRNPQIQLDEVVFVAKMPTVGVDTISFIAGKREWAERAEVALALVRNPKTPVPLAIRMLDHVGVGELRGLAKQQSLRDPIQRAVRKKILG